MMDNNSNGYKYHIYDWMLTQLGLTYTDLYVYAVIYDVSRTGTDFSESISFLCKRTNASKSTIIRALKELVDKKYILKTQKNDNRKPIVTYRHNESILKMKGIH